MSERTVYRVWHADDMIGEYDFKYYAENIERSEGLSCHVPDRAALPCDQVHIQEVRIYDNGEEWEVV